MMGLGDLGFTAEQELVYRSMLRDPSLTLDELAALHGLDRATVLTACAGLVVMGVLKHDRSEGSGFIVPQPAAGSAGHKTRRRDAGDL